MGGCQPIFRALQSLTWLKLDLCVASKFNILTLRPLQKNFDGKNSGYQNPEQLILFMASY